MRIPSERFENVAVTELSYAAMPLSSSSALADRSKCDEPEDLPQSKTPSTSTLFSHLAHLKLPQFRINTPGGGTSESSTPCSPVTSRRKQTASSVLSSGQHQPLSRHLSLSANATPVRYEVVTFLNR